MLYFSYPGAGQIINVLKQEGIYRGDRHGEEPIIANRFLFLRLLTVLPP